MENFSKWLEIHFKLSKHLKNQDDSRVRDYVIYIREHFPNLDDCPIDFKIIKESIDFLKSKGWKIYLSNNVDRPSQWIRKH